MIDLLPVAAPPIREIAAMSADSIARVRRLEAAARTLPQTALDVTHMLHAGLYARTLHLPAGVMITGAEIKCATVVIIAGEVLMLTETGVVPVKGYHVFAAAAGRKQAFVAVADTDLTMIFPTDAQTVAEAEAAFTDEADLLLSRRLEA